MKRYSPILFIWLFNFIVVSFITFLTYIRGDFSESLAWGTSSVFMANLIIYHFYATKNDKEKDRNILDE